MPASPGQSSLLAHRAHRRPSILPSSPPPSKALLSFLATIVSSTTTADASPLAFLYPSLYDDPSSSPLEDPPGPSSSSRRPRSPIKRRATAQRRRNVPTKFEQGDDGVWRKVDSYTLYGTTMCLSCTADTDLESAPSPSTSEPSSSETMSPTEEPDASGAYTSIDILDTLPSGWRPQDNQPRSDIILALSLVVAFSIFFLIISCLFWRKARRRLRNRDIEMKTRRVIRDEDAINAEKDAKKKQKLWARATARWRANARYSARQRRGRRVVRTSQPESSSVFTHRSVASTITSRSCSPSSSRCSSRRGSFSDDGNSSSRSHLTRSSRASTSSLHSPPSSPASTPHHPPAYHSRPRLPSILITGADPGPSSASPRSATLSPHVSLTETDEQEPRYAPSANTAHVATDDKAVLEQLEHLRSAPPSSNTVEDTASSSAPVWRDERLEDFPDSPPSPPPPEANASVFPAPPSPIDSRKGKMREFMDYDLFEDLGPEGPGPSAPPFESGGECLGTFDEACASAPPLMDDEHFTAGDASAPPLPSDDEDASTSAGHGPELAPSAPPGEPAPGDEPVSAQDHDRCTIVGDSFHTNRAVERDVANARASTPTILPTYSP